MSDNATAKSPRFLALDAYRGLLMVVMALDHASYFIARVHSRELWSTPLPFYPDAAWFLTRWITHPCAPGFFFLMGAGMTFLTEARRSDGWSEQRITSFFLLRGLLLILLQLVVENNAWMVGYLLTRTDVMVTRGGPMPGGGSEGFIYLGVLFSLGGSLLFWSFARRMSSWLVTLVSVAAILLTQVVTPGPEGTSTLCSPLVRALLIPGHTNAVDVLYPVVPWLGVTGLGLVFGRALRCDPEKVSRMALWTGLALLVLFVVIRAAGGFGNLNVVLPGWMGFFNVVKYPPSLSFLAISFSINFLFIASWQRMEPHLHNPLHPLVLFGRTALFFYCVHLWVFALLGLLFPTGCSLPTMYAMWLVGLAILYPLCYAYDRFKQRKPTGSAWRFF
jgi:uncharacterized membrane protein